MRQPDADRQFFEMVDDGLSPSSYFVLRALQSVTDRDGCAWPSGPALARKTGLARSTVVLCLSELEDLGIIERREAGRKSTTYQVIQNGGSE